MEVRWVKEAVSYQHRKVQKCSKSVGKGLVVLFDFCYSLFLSSLLLSLPLPVGLRYNCPTFTAFLSTKRLGNQPLSKFAAQALVQKNILAMDKGNYRN